MAKIVKEQPKEQLTPDQLQKIPTLEESKQPSQNDWEMKESTTSFKAVAEELPPVEPVEAKPLKMHQEGMDQSTGQPKVDTEQVAAQSLQTEMLLNTAFAIISGLIVSMTKVPDVGLSDEERAALVEVWKPMVSVAVSPLWMAVITTVIIIGGKAVVYMKATEGKKISSLPHDPTVTS
jgi:hypothetical protein